MSVKITYFPHGTTIDNETGTATGWLPGELSEKGIEQSKNLGKLVADRKFDVVFCSDLKRAFDSANLAFGGKYEIVIDKRLRECNYGDFCGHPSTFLTHRADFIDKPFPNGESYKDAGKRMQDFLDFLKKNYQGKHVIIIGHHATQSALEVLLNGKTWERAFAEDWRNTKSWQPGWEYAIE
jgi:broad specificity phosphatase PhoE